MGQLPAELSQEYSEKWEEAENDLGVEDFKDLFTHIRMIYRKQKMRETVLKEFREYVTPEHEPRALVDDVIIPMSEAYLEIAKQAYTSVIEAEEINGYFGWLGQIDNFDWMPPAIRFLTDHHDDSKKLANFFCDLERLAACMMINRVNITKRIERFGKLLTAMENGDDLYSVDSPLQLSTEEQTNTLIALNGALYLERNVPRYVLLRLDARLSDGEATYDHAIISIEHVLPQTPAEESEWRHWFPDDEERAAWVHRLGNLVLLSRRKNSSAHNFDFEKKKTKYFTKNGKGSPFVLTSQVLSEKSWTPDVVQRRQTALVGHLQKLWRLE